MSTGVFSGEDGILEEEVTVRYAKIRGERITRNLCLGWRGREEGVSVDSGAVATSGVAVMVGNALATAVPVAGAQEVRT